MHIEFMQWNLSKYRLLARLKDRSSWYAVRSTMDHKHWNCNTGRNGMLAFMLSWLSGLLPRAMCLASVWIFKNWPAQNQIIIPMLRQEANPLALGWNTSLPNMTCLLVWANQLTEMSPFRIISTMCWSGVLVLILFLRGSAAISDSSPKVAWKWRQKDRSNEAANLLDRNE